jgi:hypothetical protein
MIFLYSWKNYFGAIVEIFVDASFFHVQAFCSLTSIESFTVISGSYFFYLVGSRNLSRFLSNMDQTALLVSRPII